MRSWFVLFLVLLGGPAAAAIGEDKATAKLPTVVLYGDSIRLSYAPVVAKLLEGKATIVSPKGNGGDSSSVLRRIDDWAIVAKPEIVHFNCGIHDIKKAKTTGKFQVSPEEYEKNLRAIVARLRKDSKAKVCFALTTPLIDARAAKTRAERDYELLNASTEQYDVIARRVMQELDVPVNDLRTALGTSEEYGRLISDDGVHFNKQGVDKLATTVADFLKSHLPPTEKSKTK